MIIDSTHPAARFLVVFANGKALFPSRVITEDLTAFLIEDKGSGRTVRPVKYDLLAHDPEMPDHLKRFLPTSVGPVPENLQEEFERYKKTLSQEE